MGVFAFIGCSLLVAAPPLSDSVVYDFEAQIQALSSAIVVVQKMKSLDDTDRRRQIAQLILEYEQLTERRNQILADAFDQLRAVETARTIRGRLHDLIRRRHPEAMKSATQIGRLQATERFFWNALKTLGIPPAPSHLTGGHRAAALRYFLLGELTPEALHHGEIFSEVLEHLDLWIHEIDRADFFGADGSELHMRFLGLKREIKRPPFAPKAVFDLTMESLALAKRAKNPAVIAAFRRSFDDVVIEVSDARAGPSICEDVLSKRLR